MTRLAIFKNQLQDYSTLFAMKKGQQPVAPAKNSKVFLHDLG